MLVSFQLAQASTGLGTRLVAHSLEDESCCCPQKHDTMMQGVVVLVPRQPGNSGVGQAVADC